MKKSEVLLIVLFVAMIASIVLSAKISLSNRGTLTCPDCGKELYRVGVVDNIQYYECENGHEVVLVVGGAK